MNEEDGRKSDLQDDNATANDSNGEPVDEQDEERVTARLVSNCIGHDEPEPFDDLLQATSTLRTEHRRKSQTDSSVLVVVYLSTHEQVNIEHRRSAEHRSII